MKPTFANAVEQVRQRGVDIATIVLAERGLEFKPPKCRPDLLERLDHAERFHAELDPLGEASSIMQCVEYAETLGVCSQLTEHVGGILCNWGTGFFFDESDEENALKWLQLAAALNPSCYEALDGVLSVCIHGRGRPDVALPYMVIVARLKPEKDELNYVLKLIVERRKRLVPDELSMRNGQRGESRNSARWDQKCWGLWYEKELSRLDLRLAEEECRVECNPENEARVSALKEEAARSEMEFADYEWQYWSI
jgi:hypothetical protein